jgi:hypothetical protein
MIEKNNIEEMLNIIPKQLVWFGYTITSVIVTIFIVFFICIDIPQRYETPVELNYVENKLEGVFVIPQKYYEKITSDSVQIFIDNISYFGIIRQSILIGADNNSVSVDIQPLDKNLLVYNNNDLSHKSYVLIIIRSSFLEKIIDKQFLK